MGVTVARPGGGAATRKPKPTPIEVGFHWHPWRKAVHAFCFFAFLLLPYTNLMRFDIPKQRFYFAGQQLWINEFGILLLALMFLLFVIAGVSMLYGRLYCSYLCPQMIFSEVSLNLENRIRKLVTKKLIQLERATRERLSQALFLLILLPGAIFLAFTFIAYFVEPRDLWGRLTSLDVQTWGGLAGATVTALVFLDLAFLRTRFCTMICPYGYLQGMLSDKQTLLVKYEDPENACINCNKCVRVCHMEIDIRDSPHQMPCVHCGECIDACNDVLAKLGKPGLIHYGWGEASDVEADRQAPWWHKLGFRDGKRWAVLGVLMFYGIGLFVALSMREPLQVVLTPDRSRLYWESEDAKIVNRYRVRLANRSPEDAVVRLSVAGLSGAEIDVEEAGVPVPAGESVERNIAVAVRPAENNPGVNPVRFTAQVLPGGGEQEFAATFILPEEGARP